MILVLAALGGIILLTRREERRRDLDALGRALAGLGPTRPLVAPTHPTSAAQPVDVVYVQPGDLQREARRIERMLQHVPTECPPGLVLRYGHCVPEEQA